MREVRAIFALLAIGVPCFALATPAPVRVTGNTGANGELLHDTLDQLTQFAPSFGCDRITSVDTHVLPPALVPPRASFKVKGDQPASYESWKVSVCGKIKRFMIIYVTDPQGGTNIDILYPYPLD